MKHKKIPKCDYKFCFICKPVIYKISYKYCISCGNKRHDKHVYHCFQCRFTNPMHVYTHKKLCGATCRSETVVLWLRDNTCSVVCRDCCVNVPLLSILVNDCQSKFMVDIRNSIISSPLNLYLLLQYSQSLGNDYGSFLWYKCRRFQKYIFRRLQMNEPVHRCEYEWFCSGVYSHIEFNFNRLYADYMFDRLGSKKDHSYSTIMKYAGIKPYDYDKLSVEKIKQTENEYIKMTEYVDENENEDKNNCSLYYNCTCWYCEGCNYDQDHYRDMD